MSSRDRHRLVLLGSAIILAFFLLGYSLKRRGRDSAASIGRPADPASESSNPAAPSVIATETIAALTLPALSLQVHNARLTDVAKSMNTALGRSDALQVSADGGKYDLDVKDKPFWEIMLALARQDPIGFSGSGDNGIGLWYHSGTTVATYAVDGPLMVFVHHVEYRQESDGPHLSVGVSQDIDPRLRAIQYLPMDISLAMDDAGNDLKPAQPIRATGLAPNGVARANQYTQAIHLAAPRKVGKSMALTLETTILIEGTGLTARLQDMQNHVGATLNVDRDYRLTQFETNGDGSASFEVQFAVFPNLSNQSFSNPSATNAVPQPRLAVFDASGTLVWGSATGRGKIPAGSSGPYTLQIHGAAASQQIHGHFEFKGVKINEAG